MQESACAPDKKHNKSIGIFYCDTPVFRDTARQAAGKGGQVPAGIVQTLLQTGKPDTSDLQAFPR